MKLAEALATRADLQGRIEGMRERLRQSALVQEGEEPPEKEGTADGYVTSGDCAGATDR